MDLLVWSLRLLGPLLYKCYPTKNKEFFKHETQLGVVNIRGTQQTQKLQTSWNMILNS